MSDAPQNPATAGVANLKDTTKWLIGGIIASVVTILGGAQISNLGGMGPGARLYVALIAAAVALFLLGLLLRFALHVITTGRITFNEVIKGQGVDARIRAAIERMIAKQLPSPTKTLDGLEAETARLMAHGTDAEFAAFKDKLAAIEPDLAFCYKRALFDRFVGWLFGLGPIVVAAVVLYAWAANPKAPAVLAAAPKYGRLVLDTDSAVVVTGAEGDKCHVPLTPGAAVRVLVLQEEDGSAQLVTLIADPACPPVRLVQQMGRVFAPK